MGKWQTKKTDYKLSEESAHESVMELLDFYGIELKDTGEEADAKPGLSFEDALDDLAGFYRRGLLENSRDELKGFCVIQHLANGQSLTYREMKGKDRLVHAEYKMEQFDKKAAAILGKLCGLGDDVIISLMRNDYRAASTLAFVFFFV